MSRPNALRSLTLGVGFLALTLSSGVARATIPFDVHTITNNLFPWPAAVTQTLGGDFVIWGAIHYDPITHTVRHSWTDSGTRFYSDSILFGVNPGHIAATTDRWDDAVHTCFYLELGGQGRLCYATAIVNGPWTTETVQSGLQMGEMCAISHRSDIGPEIAYVDPSVTGKKTLRYGSRVLGFWTTSVLDQAPNAAPVSMPSIATNKQDATHIAWMNFNTNQIRYCRGPGTTVETVASGSGVGSLTIAVDRSGVPHIAYMKDGGLVIATRSGGTWQSVPALPVSRNVRGLSFAYGYENEPYVIYTTDDTEAPLQCATPFRGDWRVQAIGTDPAFAAGQVPSLSASSGAYPPAHLLAVWNGFGLQMAWDEPNAIAFTRARLIVCPDSDLVSTVRFWYTTRYPLDTGPVMLDFRNGAVWDSISICGQYPTTFAASIAPDTSAHFVIKASGTVTAGVGVSYGVINGTLIEPSVPVAGVDQNGDGLVSPADRDLLASRFGTVDPRSDLDFDGDVDDADRQILLAHLWHGCTTVGVDPGAANGGAPLSLSLGPNPTSGEARVAVTLSQASRVQVEVLDLACRRVRLLHDDGLSAGPHVLVWDGRDERGRETASGLYFVRARAGDRVALERLARVR